MASNKFYRNRNTGEVTENHREAVHWYREGNPVDIVRDGKVVLSWEF